MSHVMTPKQIVERLHLELHWTIEKIAGQAGCSTDMVRRWLRGENQPRGIRKAKLYQIAEKHLTHGELVLSS